MTEDSADDFQTLVAEVAAAYFANSHVAVSEIGTVIEQISKSLGAVASAAAAPAADLEAPPGRKLTGAQIKKSINPEAIISFEDGRPYKTLRRHLSVKGLTPEQYREKWGLPKDYPMVAASYSATRSQMAKDLGLGNRGGRRGAAASTAPATRRRRSATTPSNT
jgi:predicted transcriptional regulator